MILEGEARLRGLFTKPVNSEQFIADDWHTRGQARRMGSVKKLCPGLCEESRIAVLPPRIKKQSGWDSRRIILTYAQKN